MHVGIEEFGHTEKKRQREKLIFLPFASLMYQGISDSLHSPENKRRTKYIARTLNPEWHQTLVFMCIPKAVLRTKTLEVTVWDYDRFKPNDFLGEVLLDLSGKCANDEQHILTERRILRSCCHLSYSIVITADVSAARWVFPGQQATLVQPARAWWV